MSYPNAKVVIDEDGEVMAVIPHTERVSIGDVEDMVSEAQMDHVWTVVEGPVMNQRQFKEALDELADIRSGETTGEE